MYRKKAPSSPAEERPDNGRPVQPKELAVARQSLQAAFPTVNVATGYGLDPRKKGESCWLLFALTDDASVQLPAEHEGFPIRRMGVPVAGPARPRR